MNRNRGIQQCKDPLGRRLRQDSRVEELDELANRSEDLDAKQQDYNQ